MLHMVNKSPFQNGGLDSCLRFASAGDCILLMEDAAFAAATGTAKSAEVEAACKKFKVYALSADIKARAVKSVIEGIEVIDYAGFVDLVDQNKTHSWL
ncbi:DsrH family protein [Magnetococcus marinus MC-1]|uniref:DsrH family protein n=1 Tax=Magnetococcus marinus (strain ATCC BAA-1437 / JCM 17883 / MC-1) TaxID=156889 RepID=A0L8C2_MAGMM|nr:sulfurtransferase complex subunit TusB [Magnetococcus marinus]ABK44215.1 DsrH family protein [Magnetococcus marinus MC-1]